MSVGDILKNKRKEFGISQSDLAEHLHVSRQSISSWENDRSVPSLDNLISLSDLYRISIDDLLKDNEELKQKIERNQERIKQYEDKLEQLDMTIEEIESLQNEDPEYDKEDEFLFCITLIFIGLLLLPLGPVIPISYFIIKNKEKKKAVDHIEKKNK